MKNLRQQKSKCVRVGVIGGGRGLSFALGAGPHLGMELVALCDQWSLARRNMKRRFPQVTTYADYDKFLEHDLDAVILANYFHEHAPLAIQALEAGLHVMSETSACRTLGQGAALARAVEKSGKIYMLAENYCFSAPTMEMHRRYRAGEIGEAQLAECEYIHPGTATEGDKLSPGVKHWRNWIPSTYYCTHALAPIMYITNTRPLYVNAHAIAFAPDDPQRPHVRQGDIGSTILCKMNNGATTIVNGLMLRGHGVWYRLHGTRGLMETLRTQGHLLRIVHEEWDRHPGDVGETMYQPDFPIHAERARRAGHGGGDFFTNYYFAEAIRTGRQPFLDVYRGLDMTLVGIQAWRSCLQQGAPMEIPDFRKESVRKRYENDQWSPFPQDAGPGQPPPSINGIRQPSAADLKAARANWRAMGYTGR